MFDGARSRAARWGLRWAVGWMPAAPPSFLRREESRRPVGVKGTPNVRRRPIARGAPGALVGRRMDACAPSVIPAQAGIQATCGGQGHSQCSTAPDRARRAGGSGGPSDGWSLVARLGGRMDSCLRRNDGERGGGYGQGGCDGRGARSRQGGCDGQAVGGMVGAQRMTERGGAANRASGSHRR